MIRRATQKEIDYYDYDAVAALPGGCNGKPYLLECMGCGAYYWTPSFISAEFHEQRCLCGSLTLIVTQNGPKLSQQKETQMNLVEKGHAFDKLVELVGKESTSAVVIIEQGNEGHIAVRKMHHDQGWLVDTVHSKCKLTADLQFSEKYEADGTTTAEGLEHALSKVSSTPPAKIFTDEDGKRYRCELLED